MTSLPSINHINNLTNPPSSPPKAQIMHAPLRAPFLHPYFLFLSGTTTTSSSPGTPSWRDLLISSLSSQPITILNPHRPDWDSTWVESPSYPPFAEQVEWELDMLSSASLVVFYFGPDTDAPISLLELGLCVGQGKKVVVVCDPTYRKRGNVEILCGRHGIKCLGNLDGLADVVVEEMVGENMVM